MRSHSKRTLQTLLLVVTFLLLFHAPTPPPARGVGATRVGAPPPSPFTPDGALLVFSPPAISYTVDGGPLSPLVNNAAGIILVDALVQEWEDVPTSSISFANVGSITDPASGLDGTPGDVDTVNELLNLGTTGNPFIFDADGSITEGIFGFPSLTLGFAGAAASGPPGQLVGARAVLNGKFRDGVDNGIDNFEATPSEFEGVILHETGHYFGLPHDQGNDNCEADSLSCDVGGAAHDDAFGYPTMAPISLAIEETIGVHPFRTLSISDVAAVSFLYSETMNNPPTQIPFAIGFANITGNIMSSTSVAVQGGNVIARYATDDPMTPIDERRACLITNVSGHRFTGNLGQNVTGDNPGSSFGSRDPSLFGFYELPVPVVALTSVCGVNTDYTVEVESINPAYLGGSSVGPLGQTFVPAMIFDGQGEQIPLPGPPEFFSSPETNNETLPDTPAVVSVAGGDQAGIDIILNGTPPSLDAFDSVSPNNSPATATPIGDGITTGSISGFFGGLPDEDYYAFTALPGVPVTFEIFARRAPHNDHLDGVLQIVNSGGLQQDLCDTVTPGDHTGPCFNDDIIPGTIRDPMLSFESATGGTFFVRVLNYFGNPHVGHQYDLVVTGAGQAPPPAGCTKDFDGGGAGVSWADGANWNPDGVPGASDDVCIGAFSVQYDAGNTTIDTLNLPASTIAALTMNSGVVNFTSGASTISNPLTFNIGTLISSNPGTIVNLPAAGYTQSNGTLRLNGGSFSTPGTITLAGGVIEGGTPGTLTANINQTGGAISPGFSPGVLNVTGNLTQAAAGTLNIEIGGLAAGTEHDQLNVSGTANVAGTFNVTLINAFTPALNDTFTIAMCAGGPMCGSGMPTFNLPTLPAGLAWDTDVNSDDTMLVLTVVAATKDFDGGGDGTSWTDPLNWTGDTLPALGDDVGIGVNPAFPGPFTVTKNAAGGDNINSLTVADGQGVFTVSNPLNIAADSTIGSGGFTHTATFLTLNGALDIAGPFTWSGGTQNGVGTTTASGGITFSGVTAKTLNGRTLTSTGAVIYNGTGALNINTNATFNNNGTFDLQTDADILLAGATPQIFNNNGTFTKSAGATTSSITAAFNNTGTVNVNSGTLDVRAADCGSVCNGSYNVAAGATLGFSGTGPSELGAGSSTSGAGTVDFSATTVNHAGTHNVTGATLFTGGTANLTGNVVSVGTLTINSGGVANFLSGEVILPVGTVTLSNGTLTGSDTVTISGVLNWVVGTQSGSGVTNTNGGITLSGGGAKTLFGRTLNNGVGSIATVTGTGNLIISSNGTLNNNGTFDLQADADILVGGAGTRIFNNTATGTFTKSMGAASAISVEFNNAGTMITGSGAVTFSGVYMQTAGVTRLNGGSITKTGSALTINGGLLEGVNGSNITGTVNNTGGMVGPGLSPGILNIAGAGNDYTQGAGASLNIEIGGLTAGTQHDQLTVVDAASLTGALNVTLFGGFTPALGQMFTILTAGMRTGTFTTEMLPSLGGGLQFQVNYNATSVVLQVVSTGGCTVTSVASGDWSNGATWSGGVEPTGADDVCVDDADAVTVSMAGEIANSLTHTSSAAFSITGGSLTLAAASSISAAGLNQSSGTLDGAGSLTIAGPFAWSGGTQSGGGGVSTTANGGIVFNGSALLDTRFLTNNGTASFTGSGFIDLANGGIFTNAASGVINASNDGRIGSVSAIAGSLDNAGTFNRNTSGGTFRIDAVVLGAGTFNVDSGTLQANGGSIGAADVAIDAGTTFLVTGGSFDVNGGGSVTGLGTLRNQGTMRFNAGSVLTTALVNTGAQTTLATGGVVTLPSLQMLSGQIDGTDDLVTTGAFTWSGGFIIGPGTVTTNGGLTMDGAAILRSRTLNNPATISIVASGFLNLDQGAIVNNLATGVINASDNTAIGFGGSGGAGTLNNAGSFNRVTALGTFLVDANVMNTGTINVNSGVLQFARAFTQTAGLTRLYGGNIFGGVSTLNFNGGVLDAIGGSSILGDVSNAGAIVRPGMSPGTLSIAGSYTQGPGGTLEIELGGTGAGQFDMLTIISTATLGGTLNVLSFPPFTPSAGDTFQIMTFGSRIGDFASVLDNTGGVGVSVNTTPGATDYVISFATSADLAVTKTDTPDPVTEGQNVSYTITVTNAGPGTATSVSLSDTVPTNTTFVSLTAPAGWTCTTPPVGGTGTVTCTRASLASGANEVFTLVVSTSAAAVPSISNTATVSATEPDPNAANNSNTETTTVNPLTADLGVTKTDAPDPATAGQNVTYAIAVTNAGPDPATSVSLMDAVPANTTFVSFTAPAGWTATTPAVGGTGTVTATNANLAAGAPQVFTLVVATTGAAVPSISNTATVSATEADPTPANNSATATTTVNPLTADLSVTKADTPDPATAGQNVTYTITVTNAGPDPATNVSLADTVPANTTFVSFTAPAGWTSTTPAVGGTGTVAATNASLAAGTPQVFTLVVATTGAAAPSISNTATVSATEADPTPANNSDTETTTVNPLTADLAVTKTDTPDPANAGQNVTYAITVTNNGPDPATSVSLMDAVPANTTFVSLTAPAGWTCTTPPVGGTGTVTCTRASLASGANEAFTLVVATSAASAPSISNTATVSAAENDPNSGNNSDTETTAVNLVADISVTKADAADPVNVGQNIVYTVTVANAGPDAATAVMLTDTLPAAVTFVSAMASQGACGAPVGVTLTCNLGTIASGANATVQITVTAGALAAPSVTNTASATTTSVDPNNANDSDAETTTVNPVADLAIAKTDSPDPVSVGSNITYTIQVTNNGPSPATGVTVSDPIPAGLTFVSATGPAGVTCMQAGGTITCTLAGMLNSGANVTATVIVTTTAAAAPSVSNTATVSSMITDPNPANNSATATTTVSATTPANDFSLVVQPINNNVVVGQDGTFQAVVTSLPAGSNFANPVDLMCISLTGVCTVAPPQLAAGIPSGTVMITVRTADLLGSAPPARPGGPRIPPAAPLVALWTFLASLMLVSLGVIGKKTKQRRLAHCMSFGLALLVASFAIGQSACAASPGRQVAGPYTVTVTATSGTVSHSATVTLNVTDR